MAADKKHAEEAGAHSKTSISLATEREQRAETDRKMLATKTAHEQLKKEHADEVAVRLNREQMLASEKVGPRAGVQCLGPVSGARCRNSFLSRFQS